MTGAGSRVRWTLLVVALAVLLPGLAVGQARERFKEGMDALKEGRFAHAEQAFRDAIQESSEEKVGAIRRPYLPHFQLGVALEEQNRCREALAAWAESERQGEIQQAAAEYADLRQRKQRCAEQVRELDSARDAARQALARAREAELAVKRLQTKPELADVWSEGAPSFAQRQQEVTRRLAEAEQRLAGAADRHGARPLQDVKMTANQVVEDAEALVAEAEIRLRALMDAASNALDRLRNDEQRASQELAAVAYLKPYPPELKRRVEALEATLRNVGQSKRTASPEELAALQTELENAVRRLRQVAGGPPRSLRTAAEAFLSGDYESAVATLEGERYRDARATAHACLLRAASRHGLWVMGGETDDALLAALVADVEECRGLETPPPTPARFFSPRFLRFYENPPRLEADATAAGEETPPAD